MTTHIVCRDCTFESLVEGAFCAEEHVGTQEDASSHRVDHEFIGVNETGRLVTDGGYEGSGTNTETSNASFSNITRHTMGRKFLYWEIW